MELKRLKEQLQVEVDTAFLYRSIADIQENNDLAYILISLSHIEQGHADRLMVEILAVEPTYKLPQASRRARIQFKLGALFGYGSIISNLSNVERRMATNAVRKKIKEGKKPTGFEHNHLKIIEALNENQGFNVSGGLLSKFESRHRSPGGNALRAAVLGANDGLVSNMCLLAGVAGASAGNKVILLTGISGLLAGAISMSLGEWLSVQSSRELHLRQIQLETEELEASPEDEQKELTLLYQAKGMSLDEARQLAEKNFSTKEMALDALIIEELAIDKQELGGSAWEAAFASFFLFAIGAIIPLFPYFFLSGTIALYAGMTASVLGLFLIGAGITLFTGKPIVFSGCRQIAFGLGAAAVTYGIGTLIGVSL